MLKTEAERRQTRKVLISFDPSILDYVLYVTDCCTRTANTFESIIIARQSRHELASRSRLLKRQDSRARLYVIPNARSFAI